MLSESGFSVAHLVIYENWLDGHGRDLPDLLKQRGLTWTFVTRKSEHYRRNGSMHPIVSGAQRVVEVETNDLTAAFPVVRNLVAEGAAGVFTVCDYYIGHVVELCARLGLPCAYPEAAKVAHDKAHTRELLDAAGVPNPKYTFTADVEQAVIFAKEVGFPLVCKPADMAASVLVSRVENEHELREAFAAVAGFAKNFREQERNGAVLVEQWLDGPEYSVETSAEGETITVHGVTQKILDAQARFVEIGHQFPAPLDPTQTESISDFVRDCLRAVGHNHGVTHTEVTLTAAGPRLVEINSRPGGGNIVDLVRMTTGFDLLQAEIAAALGRTYVPASRPAIEGSAASAFLIPRRAGTVTEIKGLATAAACPNIEKVEIQAELPEEVDVAADNAARMCLVLARDRQGTAAADYAKRALDELDFAYEGE